MEKLSLHFHHHCLLQLSPQLKAPLRGGTGSLTDVRSPAGKCRKSLVTVDAFIYSVYVFCQDQCCMMDVFPKLYRGGARGPSCVKIPLDWNVIDLACGERGALLIRGSLSCIWESLWQRGGGSQQGAAEGQSSQVPWLETCCVTF